MCSVVADSVVVALAYTAKDALRLFTSRPILEALEEQYKDIFKSVEQTKMREAHNTQQQRLYSAFREISVGPKYRKRARDRLVPLQNRKKVSSQADKNVTVSVERKERERGGDGNGQPLRLSNIQETRLIEKEMARSHSAPDL